MISTDSPHSLASLGLRPTTRVYSSERGAWDLEAKDSFTSLSGEVHTCAQSDISFEAELLWFRAMDQEVKICEMEISHARYGHSEGLQRDLEKDLSQYAWGVWFMVHEGYKPDFKRYIEFGFKELEILEYLKEKSENAIFIDLRSLLGIMLYIFMSWIYYSEVGEGDQGMLDGRTCSHECEVLGRRFVEKYLWGIQGSSLLHYALTDFVINDEQEEKEGHVYMKYNSLGRLVEALLDWGCYQVMDWPDQNGLRPIHVAAVTKNDTPRSRAAGNWYPLSSEMEHI